MVLGMLQGFVMITLFSDFYYKAYIKDEKKKT